MADTSEPHLFEIREARNKFGLGMFATRMIQRGTRILAEPPLMTVPHGSYRRAHVEEAFYALSPEVQARIMNLASAHGQLPGQWPAEFHPLINEDDVARTREQHHARTADEASIMSVFMTNAMQWASEQRRAGESSRGFAHTGSAIFETASRINHSCMPNAHFAWNESLGAEGMQTVHAMIDIYPGDEILISYCNPLLTDEERQWELQHYGFKCRCWVCHVGRAGVSDPMSRVESEIIENRMIRQQCAELNHELHDPVEDVHWGLIYSDRHYRRMGAELVDKMKEYVCMMADIYLLYPSVARRCLDMAAYCHRIGDNRSKEEASDRAYNIMVDCMGADAPETRDTLRQLEWYERHPT